MSKNSNQDDKGTKAQFPAALCGTGPTTTVLGYGALLSEESSRLTFPDLINFRLVRVKGYRRIFRHPHLFLLKQGVVDPTTTLEIASLSAEKVDDDESSCSFIAAAFDIPSSLFTNQQRQAFIDREPEYYITTVKYYDVNDDTICLGDNGVICLANEDSAVPKEISDIAKTAASESTLGDSKFQNTVWNWTEDSNLLPARIYLRHCLLSVQKAAASEYPSTSSNDINIAAESFLNDTYLIDRQTTLREYLNRPGVHDKIMNSRPPEHLVSRYSG